MSCSLKSGAVEINRPYLDRINGCSYGVLLMRCGRALLFAAAAAE